MSTSEDTIPPTVNSGEVAPNAEHISITGRMWMPDRSAAPRAASRIRQRNCSTDSSGMATESWSGTSRSHDGPFR